MCYPEVYLEPNRISTMENSIVDIRLGSKYATIIGDGCIQQIAMDVSFTKKFPRHMAKHLFKIFSWPSWEIAK